MNWDDCTTVHFSLQKLNCFACATISTTWTGALDLISSLHWLRSKRNQSCPLSLNICSLDTSHSFLRHYRIALELVHFIKASMLESTCASFLFLTISELYGWQWSGSSRAEQIHIHACICSPAMKLFTGNFVRICIIYWTSYKQSL
jgi:hypothetical protein